MAGREKLDNDIKWLRNLMREGNIWIW